MHRSTESYSAGNKSWTPRIVQIFPDSIPLALSLSLSLSLYALFLKGARKVFLGYRCDRPEACQIPRLQRSWPVEHGALQNGMCRSEKTTLHHATFGRLMTCWQQTGRPKSLRSRRAEPGWGLDQHFRAFALEHVAANTAPSSLFKQRC